MKQTLHERKGQMSCVVFASPFLSPSIGAEHVVYVCVYGASRMVQQVKVTPAMPDNVGLILGPKRR